MARVAIFCQCENAHLLAPAALEQFRAHLSQSIDEIVEIGDLCQAVLTPQKHSLLREKLLTHEITIGACQPRAVRALLIHFLGRNAESRIDQMQFQNLRLASPNNHSTTEAPKPIPHSQAWFPVIDTLRCTDCHACLNFCLFGVYASDAEHNISVAHPELCKPDCPACARVCPQQAIIFPKHPHPSINGGALDPASPPPPKVDISNLLGGDIYHKLKKRSRFSIKPPTPEEQQAQLDHLKSLQESLGIPDHVIASAQAQVPPRGGAQ